MALAIDTRDAMSIWTVPNWQVDHSIQIAEWARHTHQINGMNLIEVIESELLLPSQ